MKLTLRVDQERFTKALNAAANEVRRELYLALGVSSRSIVSDAKQHHKFKTKSGRLEASIINEVRQDGLYAEARLEESIAAYGKYQHDGTPPHKIKARNKKALYFVSGGVPWFVPKRPFINGQKSPFWAKIERDGGHVIWKGYVNHPGIKADHFLYRAFERQRPAIVRRIDLALQNAYRKGGVS